MTDSPESIETQAPAPPVAKLVPTVRVHHGDTYVDNYEWLRDKDDPDTIAYLDAENAYTKAMTAHLEDLRESIFQEIKGRTQETDLSVPTRTGGFWYYSRTQEGKQYSLICRLPVPDVADWSPPAIEPDVSPAGESVMLDCNELAEGHDFFSLGAFDVTVDGGRLAYSTDVVGDERYTIKVLDLETGRHLPDEIPNTANGAVWSADGSHLFYTTVDDAWRPEKVWRHETGAPGPDDDVCIFHETDEKFWVSVDRTTSEQFIVISSGSRVTSDARYLNAADPTGDPVVVVPRQEGVEYEIHHALVDGTDRWLVLHNKDAVNFTLGIGAIDLQVLDDLEQVIPHSVDVRLTDVRVSKDTVAINLREGGIAQVRVHDLGRNGLEGGENIAFGEALFSAFAADFSDWEQPLVRVSYESWVTPQTILDYDPRSRELTIRKRHPVVGYDPSLLVSTREWVRSRDGVEIPLSLIHHRDVQPGTRSPLLLYGYGSYELSMDPRVRISALSLLERGMVYAVAHIRGGGEMGREWYLQGKLLDKVNTFHDFVDCARHLVDTGWTTPDRLVIHGASAGGLLVGAAVNQSPDLFAGVVAQVPFVDALTTILDPSLPLTVIEWDEWGDPLHDPNVYAAMKAYTPYENVARQPYPAIYAITNINDTRVLYLEPAKWIAQLRATAAGPRPVLFKCEMSAGHGGASGRYDLWREIADYSAWIVDVSGASDRPTHPLSSPRDLAHVTAG